MMENNNCGPTFYGASSPEPQKTDPPPVLQSSETENFLPIKGEEFRFGNLVFTSKFDSGNLQRVEKVLKDPSSTESKPGYIDPVSDVEFNVWTRPDCAGTQFENSCRSWFYFGIRGFTPGKLMKINIMNMNKQGKLYSQGHSPIYRILPHRPQWQRLKERCSFECSLTDFTLTFYYRFPECRGTVYFSFCYPWSYTESQQQMAALDERFKDADKDITERNEEDIYYHRELFTRSLDGLRIDLLTISSYQGITKEREPIFDQKLFPQRSELRCREFVGKRVFILTSRVHPGESPASFVYNGFLNFLLQSNDKRAIQLRKQYVFKFIPMLNPDGVVRGHYRTDSRGVNLNRLYLNPTLELHPTIYAAKSLLVYHHVNNCLTRREYIPNMSVIFKDLKSSKRKSKSSESERSSESCASSSSPWTGKGVSPYPTMTVEDVCVENGMREVDPAMNRCSSGESEQMDTAYSVTGNDDAAHLNHPRLRFIPAEESGIAFYVDLHGHASKRGCFMYGNHLTEEDRVIENLLFPKLISMNSAHFDYGGCNFTEKNMYTKDRKDGHSKEGSGRVAVHKAIGITHSYTLECNYNSGRLVNAIASTSDGRITPPPAAGFPPKFTEAHFEEVGRALAISAIDYTSTNPCSRIQYSDLPTVYAVRDWLRRSLRGGKGVAKYNRPSITLNPKLFTKGIGQFFSSKSEPVIRPIATTNTATNLNEPSGKTGFSFGRTARFSEGNPAQPSVASCPNKKLPDLAPVKEAHRRSFSLPSPTVLLKCAATSNKPRTLSDMTPTKSYSLRLMHTLSRQANKPLQALQYKQSDSDNKPTQAKVHNTGLKGRQPKEAPAQISPAVEQQTAPTVAYSQISSYRSNNITNGSHYVDDKNEADLDNLSDRAKELGVALEKTSLTLEKRAPTKGIKMKKADRSVPRNGLLQGSNIPLASKKREGGEKEKASAKVKEAEVKQFERELKSRMTRLNHSEAYWVEL